MVSKYFPETQEVQSVTLPLQVAQGLTQLPRLVEPELEPEPEPEVGPVGGFSKTHTPSLATVSGGQPSGGRHKRSMRYFPLTHAVHSSMDLLQVLHGLLHVWHTPATPVVPEGQSSDNTHREPLRK